MTADARRSAVASLIQQGMNQITQAGETMAKAADPLDKDFAPLHAAQQQSDAAAQADPDADPAPDAAPGQDPDPDQDPGQDPGQDPDPDTDPGQDPDPDQDPGQDPDPDADPDTFKKAVNALPLLQEIDRRMDRMDARLEGQALLHEELTAMRGYVEILAKAVTDLKDGTLTIAKAVTGAADAPLPSRSQQARGAQVPTRVIDKPSMSAEEAFAKAEKAVEAGLLAVGDVSLLNTTINSRGVQGAEAALPSTFRILKEVQ